jgi:hypothetical protein
MLSQMGIALMVSYQEVVIPYNLLGRRFLEI